VPPDDDPVLVIGSGWLGRALASQNPEWFNIAQRSLSPLRVPRGATMIVASGWSSLPADDRDARVRAELRDVNDNLDLARQRDARIVVVGSSDVCGLAAVVDGETPANPVTAYGNLKAEREILVREACGSGLDAVAVRLAPTHGPGKAQTQRLVSVVERRFVPLPRGGRHSIGFVTLADAVDALSAIAKGNQTGVLSVGGGPTPLRALVAAIASARGKSPWMLWMPAPETVARRLASSQHPGLAWLGRFSLPRVIKMEAGVPTMGVEAAGGYLAASSIEA
jgi:nucleoside-diphosphate-sugar epimerase